MILHDMMESAIADVTFNALTKKIKHCDCYDIDLISLPDSLTTKLFALHINTRSVQKIFDDLCQLISAMNSPLNLIFLTETRLNDRSNTQLINIPIYNLLQSDSMSKAGGVAMYVLETL